MMCVWWMHVAAATSNFTHLLIEVYPGNDAGLQRVGERSVAVGCATCAEVGEVMLCATSVPVERIAKHDSSVA